MSVRSHPTGSDDAVALHTGAPVLADELAPPLTARDAKHPPFRCIELDGLRGIAIIVVVIFHTPIDLLSHSAHSPLGLLAVKLWTVFRDSGWAGVDIFFALSGFLITRNLLETRNRPHFYRNFYMRRVLRITPLYLFTLAMIAVVEPHSHTYVLLSFFYLANFAQALGKFVAYPPLWSLSVEEHFYLVWPTLIRILTRRRAAIIGGVVCLLTPAMRALAYYVGHFDALISWFRFDGFMYGALVAILFTSGHNVQRRLNLWAGGVFSASALVFLAFLPLRDYTRLSLAGNALLYGCVAAVASSVIAYALAHPGSRLLAPLRNPLLRLIGDVSYWIYLIHIELVWRMSAFMDRFLPRHPAILAGYPVPVYCLELLYLGVVTVGTGILVRKYVELPILSLKRYF